MLPSPGPPVPTGRRRGRPPAPTVLVVDDERNIRRTLELVLRGEGYAVVEAPSAEEALAHPRGRAISPVDLAIFDLHAARA